MTYFTQCEVNNPKFPKLSAELSKLKMTEGGISAVCKIMEESNRRAAMDLLFGLVSEGSLTPEIAIKKLGFDDVDELFSEMEKAGYKVPEMA